MKTWSKWLIFIVIQIINYVIGYLYTSHILHDVKMWFVLIIIGTIFTIASFILILIPTNKRERDRDFIKNYRGSGIGSLRGGMFN